MQFKNYFLLGLVTLMAITACKKTSTPKPGTGGNTGTTGTTNTIDTDVYIVGSVISTTTNKYVAAYWKNGVVTQLPSSDPTVDYYGAGIAVDGNDVYVSGAYGSDLAHLLATYFKNGVETKLLDAAYTSSYTRGIAVYGGNAYISGTIKDANGTYAAFWTNIPIGLTNLTNLTPDINSDGYGIAANETGVYVAGDFYGTSDTACYWKNGSLHAYPKDGSTFDYSYAQAIALSGSNIHTVGYTIFTDKTYPKLSYWKNNDQVVYISDGSINSSANAIAANATDVYIAGSIISKNTREVAACWKNGVIKKLTDSTSDVKAQAVALAGNDAYVAGSTYVDETHETPKYWKNGVVHAVSGLNTKYGIGMAVITHPHVN